MEGKPALDLDFVLIPEENLLWEVIPQRRACPTR